MMSRHTPERLSVRRVLGRSLLHAYIIAICVFMLAPIAVIVWVSFQYGQYLAFPIERYSLRWYHDALLGHEWRDAFGTSLKLAGLATVIATTVGVLAALALHRHDFPGKRLIGVLLLGPLFMPELLMAMSLLFSFAAVGLSGSYWSLLLAHVVIATPYVIRLVLAAFGNSRQNLEEAAMTLGANEATTFRLITLPLISPGLKGGVIFAFMISYNNFLVSLFLASPGTTTIPVKIYSHLEFVADPTIAAASTVFIAITFGLTFLLRKVTRVELMPGMEQGGDR